MNIKTERICKVSNQIRNLIRKRVLNRTLGIFLVLLFSGYSFAASVAITSKQTNARYPGKFIWADLVTSNPKKAARFYEAVFGWQPTPIDENYMMLTMEGRPVAGIARNRASTIKENQNQWISFFSVNNIDKAHKRLMASGAQVVTSPVHVDGRGDFGIYVAPDSAVFGTLNSSSGDPEDSPMALNDWIWIELWSIDTKAAAEFYDVLGYDILDNWNSDNDQDLLLTVGDVARAGLVEAHESQTQSIWLAYILVDSIDETVKRTLKAGGKTLPLKGEEQTSGNIMLVSDPTGGLVAIYESAQNEYEEGGDNNKGNTEGE